MSKRKVFINSRISALALSITLFPGYLPVAYAADGELNFKVYSPDAATTPETPKLDGGRIPAVNDSTSADPAGANAATDNAQSMATPASPSADSTSPSGAAENTGMSLSKEIPQDDSTAHAEAAVQKDTATNTAGKEASPTAASPDTANSAAASPDTSSPAAASPAAASPAPSGSEAASSDSILEKAAESDTTPTKTDDTQSKVTSENAGGESTGSETAKTDSNKVLKGYVQVVPSGTKIPIIMDTAVDSDTSQEGDEFSARTAEDLTIDGATVVPAGSIIRGRIATINAPKHLDRSGSVALKFDNVTTPDNRQIPLVANLVARGGVVHARRGLKDIAIDSSIAALPTVIGLGIGAVAGNSSSSKVGVGGGALIGAGVGIVVGAAILLAKKGKKVDVRPGDELKIELAEDLHMPTM